MIQKPSNLILQTLGPYIETLYLRLNISLNKVINLVEQENDLKGFYDKRNDILLECEDENEFKDFQALIKGLNNYVYYNGLVLSGYSIFEYSLKSICQFIDKHFQNCREYEDVSRDIFGNCIKYIKETSFVDFDGKDINKYYIQLKTINKLRNLIAHYNGNLYIDKSKTLEEQKNYHLFSSDKRLKVMPNGQVYINDSEFLKSFIRNSETFLNIIIEKLKNNN